MRRRGVSNASITATVLVAVLVLLGFMSYTYYLTNSNLSTLSAQNNNLSGQIATLDQQVTSVAQRTLTIVTMTNTVVMVETTTSVTTTTSVSTLSVYPVPDNVTIAFVDVTGGYSYNIQAGSSTISGTVSGPDTFNITELFQGETINITAASGSSLPQNGFSCGGGEQFTMVLYLNGQEVAHASGTCTGSNEAVIIYTV